MRKTAGKRTLVLRTIIYREVITAMWILHRNYVDKDRQISRKS